MFEYQTAISELTGLPVSNASLYEGPSAVGSAAYLAKLANGRGEIVVSRGVHPHSRETLAHPGARLRPARGRGAAARGGDRPRRAPGPDRARHGRRDPAAAQLPRRRRGPRAADRGGEGGGRARGRRLRPAAARAAAHARRAGRRRGGRRGAVARQPPRLRRALVRLPRRPRGAPPPHAGPHRRRDARRRRAPRLRAHAADPRAAHPARAGDPQHLHGPGPQRPGRRDLPLLARQAGGRGAGRADAAPGRLRPHDARGPPRRERPARPAGRARVRPGAGRPGRGRDRALRGRGRQPRPRARAALPRAPRRPAGGDHRAPQPGRHRPARRRARPRGGRREPGPRRRPRDGGAPHERRRPDPPAARGRDDDLRALAARAARLRGARPRRARAPARRAPARAPAPRGAARAPRGLRAGDRAPLQPAQQAQLRPRHRLLPAGVVHDEAQPQAPRAGRRAAGPLPPAPLPVAAARPGGARADVEPGAGARRGLGPAPRLAAAERRLARRAGGRAAHPRLPRRPRRRPAPWC